MENFTKIVHLYHCVYDPSQYCSRYQSKKKPRVLLRSTCTGHLGARLSGVVLDQLALHMIGGPKSAFQGWLRQTIVPLSSSFPKEAMTWSFLGILTEERYFRFRTAMLLGRERKVHKRECGADSQETLRIEKKNQGETNFINTVVSLGTKSIVDIVGTGSDLFCFAGISSFPLACKTGRHLSPTPCSGSFSSSPAPPRGLHRPSGASQEHTLNVSTPRRQKLLKSPFESAPINNLFFLCQAGA